MATSPGACDACIRRYDCWELVWPLVEFDCFECVGLAPGRCQGVKGPAGCDLPLTPRHGPSGGRSVVSDGRLAADGDR